MIVIIDYGMGNTGSIKNMLEHLGHDATITDDPKTIDAATHVILPGVGSFDNGIEQLTERKLMTALKRPRRQALLGICLGMQLLFESSEEGERSGLGLIPGKVVRFTPTDRRLKVPHMGWNTVTVKPSPLTKGLEEPRFYFVHSYHAQCDAQFIIGVAHHGVDFPAIVQRQHIFGTQFHPEKSHRFGMRLLDNFVNHAPD